MAIPDPDDLILRFERRDGRPVRVRSIATDAVTAGLDEQQTARTAPPTQPRNARTPDFATVRWNGREYTLTPKQRAVVAVLWRAREDGVPFVSGDLLLEEADSVGSRLTDLFRRSDAWGTLVCRGVLYGGPVGTFCLPPDTDVEDDQ